MSRVRDEALRHDEGCFDSLVINTTNGRASPHKICMLLAVLDPALAGDVLRSAGRVVDQAAVALGLSGIQGLGYDIRSFEPDGQERFIEVKTTAFGERTPFFVSANEARFARDHGDRFHPDRLFEFRTSPRLFELAGPIERHCWLDAVTYRASFG